MLELAARHQLAGSGDEYGECLEGLLLQPYARAVLAQLSRAEVKLEDSEPVNPL